MRKISFLLIFSAALAILFKPALAADDGGSKSKKPTGLSKVAQGPVTNRTLINVNNVAMWVYSNGQAAVDPLSNSGVYFPRGTNPAATPIYQDGFVWGGRVNDGGTPAIRVGGQTFSIGTVPGAIVSRGNAENLNDRERVDRLWRIRRDFAVADLRQDAAEFFQSTAPRVTEAQIQQLRDLYRQDWLDWPAYKGAPFYDANNDGQYTPQFNDDGSPKLFPEGDEPGYADADQVVWLVTNDLDPGAVQTMYGSPSIGLEMQLTLWAYRRSDALGNVIFKQFRVIYKGTATTPANATIDSLYFCQWVDPDVGAAGDDYAGCDTTLSLGYAYNSQTLDGTYSAVGLPPPASGYDFFAGPIVRDPNSSAIFGLKRREGYRNLPMSTFAFFASGQTDADPTRGGDYNGTLQWFNLLRGFRPRPESPPDPWRDPANNITKFRVSGNPVNNSGWIDANAGDRRILLATGAFKMAVGDTQETVVAAIVALGSDRLSSIAVLKFYDRFAQDAFDNLFELPKPPAVPRLTASEFDGEILLNWGEDPAGIAATENVDQKGYLFEGYNIYQLPSAGAPLEQGVKLATVDVPNEVTVISQEIFNPESGLILELPVQFGNNTGISRTFTAQRDQLRDQNLINGQPYYFGVTAYSYNSDPAIVLKSLESPLAIVTVIPQQPKPGVRYQAENGQAVEVQHAQGTSDAVITVSVIDPSKLSGQTYKVTYDTVSADDGHGGHALVTRWNLLDGTNKLRFQSTDQSGTSDKGALIDGLQVLVSGPPAGVRRDSQDDFNSGHSGVNYIPDANRAFTSQAWTDLGLEAWGEAFGTFGTVGYGGNFALSGTTVSSNDLERVELRFSATQRQKGYRYLRRATFPPPTPEQAQYIINVAAGYPYQNYVEVPFTAWAITADGAERQVNVGFLENNDVSPAGELDGQWAPNANRGPTPSAAGREVLWIFGSNYSDTPQPQYQVDMLSNVSLDVYFAALLVKRGARVPQEGDILRIIPNFPAVPFVDEFAFASAAPIVSAETAKQDVLSTVNVFPNPYHGVNEFEQNQFNRFVTFSHLPAKTVVRIFNLGGVLVRTLTKGVSDSDNSQFLRWNLQNEAGLPVASGIYVARLEFPDLGVTKNLKIAIIQEQQFLRNF